MNLGAAEITSPVVSAVVALIVGVFGGGTIAALIRMPADKGKIVIEAAQGAVIVQTSVIDDLQDELARVRADLAEERKARAADQARYEREIASLRERVARMENGGAPGAWMS